MLTHPQNITTWKDGQNILAIPEIDGNIIHLKNIRDFDYGNGDIKPVQSYFDDTFDLNTVKSCTIYSIPFGKS